MASSGFWDGLPRPFFALAPMADVTDAAFRRIIASVGKPDVFWTEFVSCDGLCSAGREKLLRDLWFTPAERPIVAQFFGSRPEHFRTCARLAVELGFDGVDINMGCPDRSVEKQRAGAALMKDFELARDVILAAKDGAGALPVSVKTRLGYDRDILERWLPNLLSTDIAAITIHARTRAEMSKVPARWERLRAAVAIRDTLEPTGPRTFIIGNGDVDDVEQGHSRAAETKVDGVMIGRGIFGNPWLFNRDPAQNNPDQATRLSVLVQHARLFEELFAGSKRFDVMKKHVKAYLSGFRGAAEVRARVMAVSSADELEAVLREHHLL